eukprot:scaffold58678_cov63-Phaeocystis_antarctica.AAC.3
MAAPRTRRTSARPRPRRGGACAGPDGRAPRRRRASSRSRTSMCSLPSSVRRRRRLAAALAGRRERAADEHELVLVVEAAEVGGRGRGAQLPLRRRCGCHPGERALDARRPRPTRRAGLHPRPAPRGVCERYAVTRLSWV